MASTIESEVRPSQSNWLIEIPQQNDDAAFGGCRCIEGSYSKAKQIGKGTYGEVYLGKNKETGHDVALKKIRMENEKEGFPITALREIKLLKRLNNDNVICLKEIVRSQAHAVNNMKGSIYMVFDYMDHDLTGLMERMKYRLEPGHAKCYIIQLLKGLHFCHRNKILHRDLKLSNLLINNQGNLKIADFGLARIKDDAAERGMMTNKVITLWYRPPELLLGISQYGPEIDIWSVGCIIAEILTGKPLFTGEDEPEQLDKICKIMGPLNESTMPGVSKLPLYHMAKQSYPKNRLREVLHSRRLNMQAIDLIEKLLALEPGKRIDAMQAAEHPYLWENPPPADPAMLPKLPPSHEKDMKDLREAANKSQSGPASAHGKRRHSDADGVRYPADAGPSQRMRTEGYGPPGYGRMPVPMQTGYAVVPPHYASQDASYGQYVPDPYMPGRPQMPPGMNGAYSNSSQRRPHSAHGSHSAGSRQEPPSRSGQRSVAYGEKPAYLERKR